MNLLKMPSTSEAAVALQESLIDLRYLKKTISYS